VLKKDGAVLLSLSSVWDMYDGFFLRKIFPREKCKKKIRIEGARVVFNLYRKKDIIDLFRGFKLVEFSSLFITQKPYWGWYRDFSRLDKFRLKIDRVMPKTMGRIYFFVFRKTGN
jgi:hypothetical protein